MLHIDIHIKFRAFGVDFGKWDEQQNIALPLELQLAAHFLGNKQFWTYNKHGISLVLSLKSE